MKPEFRQLFKRDGTPIAVPSMPLSSAGSPESFKAPCCGQTITAEATPILQGAFQIWHWQYCPCMQEALRVVEEERQRVESMERRRERWHARQDTFDTLFPQWAQSAKAQRQTLANYTVTPDTKAVVERIKAWTEQDGNGPMGFLLTGSVGHGKTHLVRGVVQVMRGRYRTVLYMTVPYLLERLRGPSALEMPSVLRAMTQADVVVWDDLGAEKPTEWTLDRLYLLLDARYEAEKPLLVTSNWTPSALEDRVGARIVSRLLEMGPVWEVAGGDFRVTLARKRLAAG